MLLLAGIILSLLVSTILINAISIPDIITPLFQNNTISNNAATADVVCMESTDHRLDLMSCVSALSQIHPFTHPFIFRPRPPTTSNAIFLPLRYLSYDGRCAIDLSLKDGSIGDVGNGVGIYRAARSVIQQCVTTHRAGFATGFSK